MHPWPLKLNKEPILLYLYSTISYLPWQHIYYLHWKLAAKNKYRECHIFSRNTAKNKCSLYIYIYLLVGGFNLVETNIVKLDHVPRYLGHTSKIFVSIYPSPHNHGMEMGPSNISFLSFRVVFHFHDYGRKSSLSVYHQTYIYIY